MRVVLATTGSRGDVQPMMALTSRLRSEGHEAVLCAPECFASWAQALQIPFVAMGRDPKEWLGTHAEDFTQSIRLSLRPMRELASELDTQVGVLVDVCAGADLVLGASLALGAATAAELRRIPYRHVLFCPQQMPSAHHPPLTIPWHRHPQWLNRGYWWLQESALNWVVAKKLNVHRARLGLPTIGSLMGHILSKGVVVASDPALSPLPPDLGVPCIQTGAWVLPTVERALPEALETFLRAGREPIYVGFGSMVDPAPDKTTRLIAEACELAGVRAVLHRGWAGLGGDTSRQSPDGHAAPSAQPPAAPGSAATASGARAEDSSCRQISASCIVVDNVPHALLFPRLAAVVHHGGAGTVSVAARAGVPQIVVAHFLDQHYWAERITKLGLGPPPLLRSQLTARRLAHRIRACLADPGYAARALLVAERLLSEDPLAKASAALVEAASGATSTGGIIAAPAAMVGNNPHPQAERASSGSAAQP